LRSGLPAEFRLEVVAGRPETGQRAAAHLVDDDAELLGIRRRVGGAEDVALADADALIGLAVGELPQHDMERAELGDLHLAGIGLAVGRCAGRLVLAGQLVGRGGPQQQAADDEQREEPAGRAHGAQSL
jgi:hypothetical protein